MAKEITFDSAAQRKLQAGVDRLADVIKITLGPKGRNVLLQKASGPPLVVNDGATIAREITLEDPLEDMGAGIIRQAASRTNDAAGDGTTTATLLAQCIIREGLRNMAAGANPVELRKGILGGAQVAAAALQRLARPVDGPQGIARVASVSAADPGVGAMIADAMERVGRDGAISVEESGGLETVLDLAEGMQFDRGLLSPQFCTNTDLQIAELDRPYLLITDLKITSLPELVPLLEDVMEEDRPLLIIAEGLSEEVLATLALNKAQGVLQVAAVHPPAYGDGRTAIMEDLALLTGAAFISGRLGYRLQDTTLSMLGTARAVRVERSRTVITGGGGAPQDVAARVEALRRMAETTGYDFERGRVRERLARLSGGVAVIRAGAPTEAEMKEKKLRFDDALHAAQAALAEGIVPGGGVALLDAAPAVRAYRDTLDGGQRTGCGILLRALEEPVRQIASNAGLDGGTVAAGVRNRPAGVGFDVMTQEYVDMLEAGIVDPVRVTRLALLNAASVAATLLTTQAGLTERAR